jgi:hypothetical protein
MKNDKRANIKQANRRNRQRQRRPRNSSAPKPTPIDPEPHWLTPTVWTQRCTVCERKGSIAYRHSDQATLCALCLEQLGIQARESRAWRAARG